MAINNQPSAKKRFVVDGNGKIVAADGSSPQAKKKNPGINRFIAIVLWIISIALQCTFFLKYKNIFDLIPALTPVVYLIIAAVICLIFTFIASLLWKSANRAQLADRPGESVSGANMIIYALCSTLSFCPFILIILADKDCKGAPKTVGSLISLLVIAGYVLTFLNII